MYDILSDMDETTFKRAGNTVIYDTNENIIGKIGNEKYEYVNITDISDYVQKGYIAKEDKRFTSHHGVDIRATIRAAIALVKNHGAITQGGSTITQQVVKNNLLSQERSYDRKILEIFIAFQLEKEYTKTQIMEFYCNSNYYGNGCYGIEGASEYYYGKSASDLTLGEAAILVATSNSPNNYNPVADYELSMEKKDAVLDAMLECGYIDQDEYDNASRERPEIVQKSENFANENYMITYATHCAALKLMEMENFQFQYVFEDSETSSSYKESYSEAYQNALEEVKTGGYEIYTSFDPDIQSSLQASVDEKLADFPDVDEDGIYKLQGAAVCIDNQTNLIVAVVGGREEKGSLNRGYQAKRQPGSAIKPLLDYGPALNEGVITPSTVYVDEETTINGYTPKNSGGSYRGAVTMREALARSINTIAVQLYTNVGAETCLSYLDKMQFSSLVYADSTATSLAVGGFTYGTTVDDIARGYSTLANGGSYSYNTCIKSLSNSENGLVYECNSKEDIEVYTEDAAFMMTDMLIGVFEERYGTAHSWQTDDQVYAGKTGTTNDNKDAWFCGYSYYYTTAVWIGYDTPEEMDGVYGGTYPAEIWCDFMNNIHQGLEKKDFAIPDTIQLENSSGKKKTPSYTSDIYHSRPSGWDYISEILKEKELENEMKRENDKILAEAEAAVAEFEDFQITTGEEALSLGEKYNAVLEMVNKVNDVDSKNELLERAAYKYELLSGDVVSKWSEAAEIAKETAQKKKDAENVVEAQKSLEMAAEEEKQKLIELAQWYIDQINSLTVYSSYAEQLLNEAEEAVQACSGYTEYAALNSDLQQAKNIISNLPSYNNNATDLDQDAPIVP